MVPSIREKVTARLFSAEAFSSLRVIIVFCLPRERERERKYLLLHLGERVFFVLIFAKKSPGCGGGRGTSRVVGGLGTSEGLTRLADLSPAVPPSQGRLDMIPQICE